MDDSANQGLSMQALQREEEAPSQGGQVLATGGKGEERNGRALEHARANCILREEQERSNRGGRR